MTHVISYHSYRDKRIRIRNIVFNTTFNNILAILWSVLLVEETGGPGENHLHFCTCHKSLANFITQCCIEYIHVGTDCIGSC